MTFDAADPTAARFLRPPRTFGELLGRRSTVEGLRSRIKQKAYQTGVILYGPTGVGKRTLARIFAKAIQCEETSSDGSPCNQCPTCQAVEAHASFGNIEVDAAKAEDTKEVAKDLVERVRRFSLADRRVITIANADLFSPQAFDMLLKPLENMEDDVSFIFTATNLKSVRLAGRSRCVMYQVRPLAPAEARQYLAAYCEVNGVGCDERVFDIIIAYARGLPDELNKACTLAFGSGRATLETTRTVLGLDWVEDIAAMWHAMLVNPGPLQVRWRSDASASVVEQIRRLHVFHQYVYLQGLHQLPAEDLVGDPALVHLKSEVLAKAVTALRNRDKGNNGETLWRALTINALSSDQEGIHASLSTKRSIQNAGSPTKD